jgi:hypothetical protein
VADDLPGLDAFGEALVAAARREDARCIQHAYRGQTPVYDLDPSGIPSLDRFGRDLVARVRRRDRRRARWRRVGLGALVALPIAATSGAATAVVLRQAVISAPDPSQVPDDQTPLAGTAKVSTVRAADPGTGLPWTVRVARSKTGFTCTTVGQVRDGVFGLTGLDGVFRRLPGELSDACGQGGTLTGARVLAADKPADVRSIVYGVAGAKLRGVTLEAATGNRALRIGPDGTFVAALRGYPEDNAVAVTLRFAGGRTEHHNFGAATGTIPDPGGGQAWTVERYTLGTRFQCAHVRPARRSGAGIIVRADGSSDQVVTPTACLALRTSDRAWVADARRLKPGDEGVPGFDRWGWQSNPARTVVWGVARNGKTLRSVTLRGAGEPRKLTISKQGAFAAVLLASVDPAKLSLEVALADGTVQHGKPGDGLAPDLVKSRRPR